MDSLSVRSSLKLSLKFLWPNILYVDSPHIDSGHQVPTSDPQVILPQHQKRKDRKVPKRFRLNQGPNYEISSSGNRSVMHKRINTKIPSRGTKYRLHAYMHCTGVMIFGRSTPWTILSFFTKLSFQWQAQYLWVHETPTWRGNRALGDQGSISHPNI